MHSKSIGFVKFFKNVKKQGVFFAFIIEIAQL